MRPLGACARWWVIVDSALLCRRAANQVAMACNTAGATLLKQSYERSRYDEAFGLLQRAVYVTEVYCLHYHLLYLALATLTLQP